MRAPARFPRLLTALPGLPGLALFCWTPGAALAAGECDCEHLITPDMATANGAELGVAPGESVCVQAGAREFLRLYDFVGSSDQWIEIRNCEGVVEIDNADRGYGLTMDGSRYVHITGAGDPDHTYGFRIRASRDGPDYSASGVVVAGLSSDYELDYFEVYESGFAGFNLKTEPTCDGSANLGNFIQYDTRVHHHWIHDTRGEGIYLGSTGYGGRDYQCDGQTTTLYPHEHHGVEVHHNLIENTGWDGMQVGVSPVDCRVWANYIRDVGLEGVEFQQQGMQIGGNSSCEIWGNRLERGPTNGIFVLAAGETSVHDNLVVDFGSSGIYANSNDLPEFDGVSYSFVHNTVLRSGRFGIALFGPNLAGSVGWNNLIAGSAEGDLAVANDIDFDGQNNITDMALEALGFVDAANGDFHLAEDSPARDAGRPAIEWSSTDIAGVARDPDTPDVGAYEYSTEPPPSGDGDGDAGEGGAEGDWTDAGGEEDSDEGGSGGSGGSGGTSGADEAGAAEDASGGCGCTGTNPLDAPPWGLALLVLLGVASRPRRRR